MTHNTPVADKALAERLEALLAEMDSKDLALGTKDGDLAAFTFCRTLYHTALSRAHRSGQLITLAEAQAMVAELEAENAELKRQLGGGCDAANGGDHVVMIEVRGRSRYAFCIHCGESMVGVRYNHEPRAAATGTKDGM